MNIGIIVHSQTGNTLSVAEKIGEKLKENGHGVQIEKVVPQGDVRPGPGTGPVQFSSNPGVEGYDAVVFAAPVQAFSLSPAMKAYLGQTGQLQGKKIALLVTKQLKGKWTGGNGAIKKMKALTAEKGGEVAGSAMVIWSSSEREAMITQAVDEITALF